MKAPRNRQVFVIGYGVATPLGGTFAQTWQRAVKGEAGFRKVTRCQTESPCNVVGEIPDWNPRAFDFSSEKEIYNWNAGLSSSPWLSSRRPLRMQGWSWIQIPPPGRPA